MYKLSRGGSEYLEKSQRHRNQELTAGYHGVLFYLCPVDATVNSIVAVHSITMWSMEDLVSNRENHQGVQIVAQKNWLAPMVQGTEVCEQYHETSLPAH